MPIQPGFAGELPGLRLTISNQGDNLVVGSRNFNEGHHGRTMTYRLRGDGGEYTQIHVVKGQVADDHEGSSVSITGDGRYYVSGATGFETTGSGEAVKDNGGAVRNFYTGSAFLGENKGDASGFSNSLVNYEMDKLFVAIGAIFNDPSSERTNTGHVRVYTYTIGEDGAD